MIKLKIFNQTINLFYIRNFLDIIKYFITTGKLYNSFIKKRKKSY